MIAARSGLDFARDRCKMPTMTRRLLLAAALAVVALPVGVARAEDPPVVTAPPVMVTAPTDYCNVVIIIDGPVYPDGSQGPSSQIFAPCGEPVVIPPIVIDEAATVVVAPAAAPVVAARLGYVPAWVTSALGWAS